MSTKKRQKTPQIFRCDTCDFNCSKPSDFTRHLSTAKHNLSTKSTGFTPKNAEKFNCDCGKTYKDRSGLWRHKKSCNMKQIINEENKIDAAIVKELIQQNKDLQTQLVKLADSKTDITINNTQNRFNINVFLNEQCRDALNFTDFIDRIEVSHDDLENNAQLGFVNGISKIIMDNLKQLTLHERPIHCTDLKRETMYIKDDNMWQKDEEKGKINQGIQEVSRKSMSSLMQWKQTNPEYENMDSDFSNRCIVIQKQCIAGDKKENYYSKVGHIIAKENAVNKDFFNSKNAKLNI